MPQWEKQYLMHIFYINIFFVFYNGLKGCSVSLKNIYNPKQVGEQWSTAEKLCKPYPHTNNLKHTGLLLL